LFLALNHAWNRSEIRNTVRPFTWEGCAEQYACAYSEVLSKIKESSISENH